MSLDITGIDQIKNEHTGRKVINTDVESIAEAMLDAYLDTIDYENETYEDTFHEIKKVFNDGYGKFIYEASFLIEAEEEIASVILINLFENEPLITYLFTRKRFLNKGMASSLINLSQIELLKSGYKKINLFVNEDNQRAINIYLKAGFKIVN